MHRGLRITIQTLLIATGALVALPQVKGWFVYERGQGIVLDVFPQDLGDGTVRLSVAWEFTAPGTPAAKTGGSAGAGDSAGAGGSDGARSWLSYQLCDGLFRPLAQDPVVAAERADAVMRRWLDEGDQRKHYRTVFYLPEDPGGTAMIRDESAAQGERRLPLGIALVVVGLGWLLFGRRATEWTTQWYARKDRTL